MSDSIKERFLKEHELPMDQLEKVSGGDSYQPFFCEDCRTSFASAAALTEHHRTVHRS